jgi:hypothetical protein
MSLKLNSNHFTGSLPPLNQTHLKAFNVSDNNLEYPIHFTKTLCQFSDVTYSKNPSLNSEFIHHECIQYRRRPKRRPKFVMPLIYTVVALVICGIVLATAGYFMFMITKEKGPVRVNLEMTDIDRHD